MSVHCWLGNPYAMASLDALEDAVADQAECFKSGDTLLWIDRQQPSGQSCAHLSQLHSGVQIQPNAVDVGSLVGRGQLLDTLRQREPTRLTVWLIAPGGDTACAEPLAAQVASWLAGTIEVVDGALELAKVRGAGVITVVFPPQIESDYGLPIVAASRAFFDTWVVVTQARLEEQGVTGVSVQLLTL